MSLKKLAKQTALYGLSSIFGRLLTFIFLTPYLSYRFHDAPELMGIQTEVYAWAAFLNVLLTYRMETALMRFGAEPKERAAVFSTAQWSILAVVLLSAALLVLANPYLAEALGYRPEYLLLLAGITALDALSALPFALLRLQEKALRFALIRLSNLFLHLGGILFFLEFLPRYAPDYYGGKDLALTYVFGANLLASGFSFLLLLPSTRGIWQRVFESERMRRLWAYAWPLLLASFAGIINEVMDRSLLRWLLPGDTATRLALVGIYGACYKLAIFMNLFTQAFNYAAEPFFFKHAQNKGDRGVYAKVTLAFALVGCLAFLGVTLFMDLAQYFVAPVYRQGLGVVPILLLANWCLGLYYNVSIWYKLAENQTRFSAYIAGAGALITLSANLILIPFLGYMGAAWATLLCYTGMLALTYYYGQKYFPVPYPLPKILAYLGLSLGLYALFQVWNPEGFWLRQGYAFLACAGFAALAWWRERGYLRRF